MYVYINICSAIRVSMAYVNIHRIYAYGNDAVCIFSYEYLFEAAKSNYEVKRFGESAR